MVLAVAFILMVPLVAMQFTDEVAWTLSDFVVAGFLLLGTGLAYEFAVKKAASNTYRLAVGLAVVSALMLVWVNLAVGIIGNENNPANMIYFAVLAVGIIGATAARLEPQRMARALFAMAIAQALVSVIALIIWKRQVISAEGSFGLVDLIGVNLFFVALFVGSALLFRHAARN